MSLPTKYAPALTVLNHLLAAPDILTQIQSLPAPTLLKLVHRIGLEDSSEILALASGEQLSVELGRLQAPETGPALGRRSRAQREQEQAWSIRAFVHWMG